MKLVLVLCVVLTFLTAPAHAQQPAVPYAATNTALKALRGGQYPVVLRLGIVTPGDGGMTLFIWDGTSICTDNTIRCVAPAAGGTGRWIANVFPQVPIVKTADYNILVSDNGATFENTGATVNIIGSLPAWQPGLFYCFDDTVAHYHRISTASVAQIAVGSVISASNGYIRSTTPHSRACLYASSFANIWIATITGTWEIN